VANIGKDEIASQNLINPEEVKGGAEVASDTRQANQALLDLHWADHTWSVSLEGEAGVCSIWSLTRDMGRLSLTKVCYLFC